MTSQGPHWLVLIFLTAFITAVTTQAMPHILRGLRYVLRKGNYYRKVILAPRQVRLATRREILSNKRWWPAWLLRSTIFRWFEREPNAIWPDVNRVHENHRNEAVRSQARNLLWHTTTVERLTAGMVYDRADVAHGLNQHVLAIELEGDRAKIVTEGSYDARGHLQKRAWTECDRKTKVRVCLGWCRNMPGCPYCPSFHD